MDDDADDDDMDEGVDDDVVDEDSDVEMDGDVAESIIVMDFLCT